MRRRTVFSLLASLATLAFLGFYLGLARSQDTPVNQGVVPFFAGALLLAAVLCALVPTRSTNRLAIVALVLLAALSLLALMSIGIFLLPAGVLLVVAMQPTNEEQEQPR